MMPLPRLRLRHGLRRLAGAPALTAAVVCVLALGLGANTLVFLVLDRLVLRPVPFPGLDRLVAVWTTDLTQGVTKGAVSAPDFLDWQRRSRSFAAMAALQRAPVSLRAGGAAEQVQGARVTAGFFSLLGAGAARGRLPQGADGEDAGAGVVISHGLWQRAFGSDPGIIGQAVEVDGRPLTVLGILRAGEEFPRGAEVWIPVRLAPAVEERGSRSLLVVARLAPGVGVDQAQAELSGVADQLRREFPATNGQAGAAVVSLRDELAANQRAMVVLVFWAVGLTLVVVCINVANMLLVRAAARRKEMGIAVALGARRADVVGQILGEILLLALSSAALGGAVAFAGRKLLAASALGPVVRAESLAFDFRVLAFGLGVTLAAALLMALAPAAQYLGGGLNVLAGGESGRGRSNRVLRLQRLLVGLQLAVSLPLLVGALLLLQNLRQIREVDLGFRADGVHVLRVAFPRSGPGAPQRADLVADGLAQVAGLPGIEGAGLISDLPFSGSRTSGGFVITGRSEASPEGAPVSDLRVVAGDYFQTLGIPVKRGRAFLDSDGRFSPGVAVINESLARRYWPGENPIGQRIRVGSPEEVALFGGSVERQIVGVVGDVVHEGLGGERRPELYLPYGQHPSTSASLVFRVRGQDPAGVAAEVSSAFLDGHTDFVVSGYVPMREVLSRSLGYPEVQASVVTFLGLLSLALVAMSVYAVVSYFLAQWRHSLAVRIALGAQRRDILALVARQGAILCLGGLAAGAAGAVVVLRLLMRQVSLVHPQTLPALLLGAAVIATLALAATLLPARRLLRAEPSALLRFE